jgi:hypothetical protein
LCKLEAFLPLINYFAIRKENELKSTTALILNVRQAIEKVQPFGIDLCSGVRTNGKLDEQKLKDFLKPLRTKKSRRAQSR